jgi:hypothetical protein
MKPELPERVRRRRQFLRRHVWILWGLSLLLSVLAAIHAVRGYPWIGALYVAETILILLVIVAVTE